MLKVRRFESSKYLAAIRKLPCAHCGASGCDAHHLIGVGVGGAIGSKASDLFAVPLCRTCHTELHREPHEWQKAQVRWLHDTLNIMGETGVIKA